MRRRHLTASVLGLLALAFLTNASRGEKELFNEDLLKFFRFRALGPARQGSRILDIEVPPGRPYTFYVATASGGLWKTENNGTTFRPIFDDQTAIAIGDVAVAPSNPDILWVGTGTPASGRITLRGDGVYKSTDGGRTWTYAGLKKTRHIGRIAIHPQNPDIVYVAALGYHFSFNRERGLFKTTDGGATWEKVLYISERVGVVDVALNPENPDIVYAVTYDKWRLPWHFEESGPESGIYKSTDAGKTWRRLERGLPKGKFGRIGIAIYPKNPDILYAIVENANMRPPTEEEAKQDRAASRKPENRRIGGEVYRSDDGGESWTKRNAIEDNLGGGKWYGQIRVDPNDDQVVYVMSTRLQRSMDGGRTWGKKGIENLAAGVHVDHHVVWIDPENSNHLILGNDGGLAVSYDRGKTWDVYENIPGAQYYAIGVDMEEPYNIYGGTQDTGSLKIPSQSIYGEITRDDWASVGGGDGMHNQVDPTDSRWLYNAYQLGAIQRVDQKLGIWKSIRPRREKEEPALRFNWTSPILISPHNSQIIYLGANVLLRSLDRGERWQEISPDLTTHDPEKLKGNIEYGTITSIAESPVTPGILWVGTDDGKVQISRNGGGTWTDRTPNLTQAGAPEEYYVSRVFASFHDEAVAYIVKTGFQRDDYRPFLFKTEDFGETWRSITGDLPEGTVHVIVEDRKNPALLFVGKEFGVWVTIDGGQRWVKMTGNMPTQDVFDLLIHPRENDLVVGTYGRGIYVTDISPLQELSYEMLEKDVHLFEIEPRIQWRYRPRGRIFGHRQFRAPNEPNGMMVHYYLKNNLPEDVKVMITDPYGKQAARLKGPGRAGIHRIVWDMRQQPPEEESREEAGIRRSRRGRGEFVEPGEYVVILEAGGKRLQQRAVIRPMPLH